MGFFEWTPGVWRLAILLCNVIPAVLGKRHAVYWNSTNTRLTSGELTIQVNLNDYLDIYCPHYPDQETGGPQQQQQHQPETLALYLIGQPSFQGCVETRGAIKRWECNTPYAPFGPVRFSEKIQRFTPFSLGFEFLPGHHYYYSSLPSDEGPPLPCMKLRVTVCCESTASEGSKQQQDLPVRQNQAPSLRTSPYLLLSPALLFLLLQLIT
ncbi:hypothetical protein NL108_001299 [Boleophthalmus pectinirostris]|uniref:ephrin-A4 isoform X2 n=1 Tax=Boleophthalmus pectinirostris TaxID=150288 RepID=UPI000A1C1B49|nr:ephrin-A4 isoform X2 [Boleophthalmus pectinirostris]KAJ0066071.1 hypothetical protein NL108_001299 [Boleophthalmus pectinirostris]